MLNLEIDGVAVKFAGDLYDNINNVQQGRRVFVDAGNMLLKNTVLKKQREWLRY